MRTHGSLNDDGGAMAPCKVESAFEALVDKIGANDLVDRIEASDWKVPFADIIMEIAGEVL